MSFGRAAALIALVAIGTVGGCFLDVEGVTPPPESCNQAEDCSDPGACATRVCVDGFCVPEPVADGLAGAQTAGDCQTLSCLDGEVLTEVDDSDSDDGRSCTEDSCTAGGPVHDPLAEGSECNIGTVTGVCSDDGDCLIECSSTAPCPDADPCLSPACIEQLCEYSPVSGEPVFAVPDEDEGDCKRPFCANGVLGTTEDGTDFPIEDGLECTDGICTGEVPSQENVPLGTPCGVGLACDANGACDGCNDNIQCGLPVDCVTPTCTASFECMDMFAPEHTPCSGGNVCKMGGACVECADETDCSLPGECDYSTCDADVCNPQQVAVGMPCQMTVDDVCNSLGDCVECIMPSHCPAPAECVASYGCTGEQCVPVFAAVGTPCSTGFCDLTGTCVECTLSIQCTGTDVCCPPGVCQPGPC